MKKINLLVADAFLFPGGGQEGTVIQILKLLDREKFNISFATGDDAKLPEYFPTDVAIYRVGLRSKYDLYSCLKILQLLRKKKINVINIHGFRAALLFRLASLMLLRNINIIYTAQVNHEQLLDYSTSPLNRLSVLIGNLLDVIATDQIVFVSHKNMERRIAGRPRLNEKKCSVIFNGVNISDVQPYVKQTRSGTRKVIVCLSALVKRKGIHILIEAARILRNRGIVDFEIKVGGEGGERIVLERMIKEYGLEERFTLLGYTDRRNLLSVGDIFVLPTFSEGLPLSLLEAGLFRLPVIASKVDGIPEIVLDEENGILVEPGDTVALADAIEKLLTEKDLRNLYGEELHRTVIDRFSEIAMIEKYTNLFINAWRE